MAARLFASYPASSDARANRYLNQLGQALALYSNRLGIYAGDHLRPLESGEVNAFAAPGGFILVTRGILEHVSGEGELAAVPAPETARVQNRDALGAVWNSRLTRGLGRNGPGSGDSMRPRA